jgi:Brp/Blh family beta-carotene 15,15'-monooxygenase
MKFWIKGLLVLGAILVSHLVPSDLAQLIVAGALIMGLGIPHGATDHVIYNVIEKKSVNSATTLSFLAQYLGIIGLYVILWYFFPLLSLSLFIGISAYHFGETQFEYLGLISFLTHLLYISWGLLILGVLLGVHLTEVTALLQPLTGHPELYDWLALYQTPLVLSLLSLTLFTLFFNRRVSRDTSFLLKEIGELIILAVLFFNSSLLIGFAVFFAFWHSRDAVMIQIREFRALRPAFSLREFMQLALPFTLLSAFGIALLLILFNYFTTPIPEVTLFFVMISLLTMPHMFIIARFYRQKP